MDERPFEEKLSQILHRNHTTAEQEFRSAGPVAAVPPLGPAPYVTGVKSWICGLRMPKIPAH